MADKSKRSDGFEQKVLDILEDFSNRFDKIDQRFNSIDQRFNSIDQRLDKQDDYIESQFAAIQEQFLDFEQRMDEIKGILNDIRNWQDAISKQLEISEQERLIMGRQLDRLDAWCHELAGAIGHRLSSQI